MKRTLYPIAILSFLFIASCGSEENEADTVTEAGDMKDGDAGENDTLDTKFESPEYEFFPPSPIQVAEIFHKAGLEYMEDLPLDPEMAEQYHTEAKNEVIFGVYSADLAYAVLHNKQQAARDYMHTVKKVASKTGIGKVFEGEHLVDRFENNIGTPDSIIPLLIDIKERTDELMEENDESYKTAVHYAGAWLEGMYLGARGSQIQNNSKLGAVVGENMVILESLIKGLNAQPQKNSVIEMLIERFEKIEVTFNEFDSVQEARNGTSAEPELTEEELNVFTKLIIDSREELVNP